MSGPRLRIKKLRITTCFGIAIAGAVCDALAGGLMLAGVGQALYAHTAAFVLYGAVLLFLGVVEKGPEKKGRRVRLLGLFFMLLLANLGLPLLDWLEAPVLPLLLVMYWRAGGSRMAGGAPVLALLVLAELAAGLTRSLAIMPGALGASPLLVEGGVILAVGLVRGLAMALLLAHNKKNPPPEAAAESPLR